MGGAVALECQLLFAMGEKKVAVGLTDEAAALMIFLLSGWAGFITGQMIPLTGGDWL